MLLWGLSVAMGAEVRALVEVSPDGLEVLALRPGRTTPRARPALPQPKGPDFLVLQVRSEEGTVLARVDVPDPRVRSVILPDGGGRAGARPRGAVGVTLPWPDGASHVTDVRGQRWDPVSQPPQIPASPPERVLGDGPSDERVDLVILSEGYASADLPQFEADAAAVAAHMVSLEPWSRYQGILNVWRVDVPSKDSGVVPGAVVDTAFSCSYGCRGIAQLICCDDVAVATAAEEAVPGAEGVLVLVNGSTYGGSGGAAYATSYNADQMLDVATHELGHSLANLEDEYPYGEPDPNGLTVAYRNCAPKPLVFWDEWMEPKLAHKGVGAFDGCSYVGLFGPVQDTCKMGVMDETFCPVCREWLTVSLIQELPPMASVVTPPVGDVLMLGDEVEDLVQVEIAPVLDDELIEITWTLDGLPLDLEGPLVDLGCGMVPGGELRVHVRDTTTWVRMFANDVDLEVELGPWTVSTALCGSAIDTGGGDEPKVEEDGCGGCQGSNAALLAPFLLFGMRRRSA